MIPCEVCGCEFRPWYAGRRCCAKPECGKEMLRRVGREIGVRRRAAADVTRQAEDPRICKMCGKDFYPWPGERVVNFRVRKTCLSDVCLLGAKSHLPPFADAAP